MVSALILRPILTNQAIEAVIASVLERINRTDGSTWHEETISDYATFMNIQEGLASTDYRCNYSMVDTDYLLPILMLRTQEKGNVWQLYLPLQRARLTRITKV
jgi:hypothetical protein